MPRTPVCPSRKRADFLHIRLHLQLDHSGRHSRGANPQAHHAEDRGHRAGSGFIAAPLGAR